MTNRRTINIARSTASLFTAKLVGFAVIFLGIVYFSRSVDPSAVGVFFLFQALVNVLGIAVDLGLTGAAKKRISEGSDPDVIFTTAILLKAVPIALTVIGLLSLRRWITGYLGASLVGWMVVAVVVQQYAMFIVDVIEGELRVSRTAYLHLTRSVSWIGTSAALIHLGYGMRGIVIGFTIGYVVMLLLGLWMADATVARPSRDAVRSLTEFAKFNFISNLNWELHSWVDVLMLGLFATQIDVAAYEMAWRVSEVVILFSTTIGTVIYPQISAWETEGLLDRVESVTQRSITPSVLPVIPALFGSVIIAGDLLAVVFGPAYRIAALALVILMGQKVLQSLYVIFSRCLSAIDHPELDARAKVASIVVNIILNAVLVSAFGLVGAAVATTLAFAVNLALTTHYLSSFIEIRLPYAEIRWCVFASLAMLVPVVFLAENEPLSLVRLVAICGSGMLVYAGVLVLSPLRGMLLERLSSLTS